MKRISVIIGALAVLMISNLPSVQAQGEGKYTSLNVLIPILWTHRN